MRLQVGDIAPSFDVCTLRGERVIAPGAQEAPLLHLQFRRFAGCPICNLHVRAVVERLPELKAAGVREVIAFHSPEEQLRPFDSLPIDLVADPGRKLYDAFGVGTSLQSVLDPRAWTAALRGMPLTGLTRAMDPSVTHLGLPAEFLIGAGGRILALKYGVHADDQWTVDEVLERVRAATV